MEYWQFSPSSLHLLERCLNASSNANLSAKKWQDLFHETTKTNDMVLVAECSTISYDSDDTVIWESQETVQNAEATVDFSELKKICVEIEAASNKLDFLTKASTDYDVLLPFLAQRLTKATMEMIFEDLLRNKFIDPSFVSKFFVKFLPDYIKRETSCVALDLLSRSYKSHPEPFRFLMTELLLDTEMTTKVLEEFFITVDSTAHSQFLHDLAEKEVREDSFNTHMNTICFLYNSSLKSNEIQNFILESLVRSAETCSKDKSYGRFMLKFFQVVKESKIPMDKSVLEQLLEYHETMFQKPCLTILKAL